jgi:hypothetical protein
LQHATPPTVRSGDMSLAGDEHRGSARLLCSGLCAAAAAAERKTVKDKLMILDGQPTKRNTAATNVFDAKVQRSGQCRLSESRCVALPWQAGAADAVGAQWSARLIVARFDSTVA